MTEEIINADGSRNWEANILLDNIKRLEQENKELLEARNHFMGVNLKYFNALEEIREVLKFYADTWVDEKMYPNLHYDNTKAKEGLSRINEVLNDN